MSRTPIETKIAAVGAITEGLSLRAVSRRTGLTRNRIGRAWCWRWVAPLNGS